MVCVIFVLHKMGYIKLSGLLLSFFWLDRLSEYAPTYFDLSSFPEGEMKKALERAKKKKLLDGGVSSKKVKAQLEKKDNDGSDNITNARKKAKHEA